MQQNVDAFPSPAYALAKTVLQLVGEFDFEATFSQEELLYSPTAYVLFFHLCNYYANSVHQPVGKLPN